MEYRSKDDLVEITQTAEYGEPPQPEIFDVPREDLILAVAQAKQEMKRFAITIIPIAKKILPHKYNDLANKLVWGVPDYQVLK